MIKYILDMLVVVTVCPMFSSRYFCIYQLIRFLPQHHVLLLLPEILLV